MAHPDDYAEVILEVLTDEDLGDYEGFGALCWMYRRLHPLEQPYMREGLVGAIQSLTNPDQLGELADAIHLAYQFDAHDLPMVATIERIRDGDFYADERVAREVNNFLSQIRQLA